MPRVIEITKDWAPKSYQQPFWDAIRKQGKKRAIVFAHRRWGKDECVLNFAFTQICSRPGNYWHMLPIAEQARKAIWTAVDETSGKRRIDIAFPKEARKRTLENEMRIEFWNGSTWQVIGSDNFNMLVGSSPVGIVFSEWALARPEAWAYLRPILARNNGWAIFITTPRGKNHAWRMLTEVAKNDPQTWYWEVSSVKGIERHGYKDNIGTGVFSNEELYRNLDEMQKEYASMEQGRSVFQQEFECSFDAAILGAYYAEALRTAEAEGRIRPIPIDRQVRVHTAWDLGWKAATAIWFIQSVGREYRIVDFYQGSLANLGEYVDVLHEKRIKRGFRYWNHYLPHDVAVHELNTGMSRKETLYGLGLTDIEVVPLHSVPDGINATRHVLDRSFIDPEYCKDGIEHLKQYKQQWNDKLKDWGRKPVEDEHAHAADALRQFAAGHAEKAIVRRIEDRSRPWGYGGRSEGPSHWSA